MRRRSGDSDVADEGRRLSQRIGFYLGPAAFALIVLWPAPEGAFAEAARRLAVSEPGAVVAIERAVQTVRRAPAAPSQ